MSADALGWHDAKSPAAMALMSLYIALFIDVTAHIFWSSSEFHWPMKFIC